MPKWFRMHLGIIPNNLTAPTNMQKKTHETHGPQRFSTTNVKSITYQHFPITTFHNASMCVLLGIQGQKLNVQLGPFLYPNLSPQSHIEPSAGPTTQPQAKYHRRRSSRSKGKSADPRMIYDSHGVKRSFLRYVVARSSHPSCRWGPLNHTNSAKS